MGIFIQTGKNRFKYLSLFFMFLFFVIIKNESYSQNYKSSISGIKLKTTITPRRGDVAFLSKAMEVIVTPVDTFNNEIISIPEGLPFKLFSNAPEDIAEANFNANRTIYGKYYTYITPNRVHDIKNSNELQIGAFLMGSNGLPDLSTGSYTKILVVNHIPKKPDTITFKVRDLQYDVDITNSKLKLAKNTDKFKFSWGAAIDSNDKPLLKSFKGFLGEIYSIPDTCVVRYSFRIKEYDYAPFPIYCDTMTQIVLTGSQLKAILFFIRGSQPTTVKSVFFNWYLSFEDDTYKYNDPVYSYDLTTDLKRQELYYDVEIGVSKKEQKFNFSLHQNYPNPFNPSTNITYSLPEQCFVDLKVYDVIGREVATLVNSIMPMGEHSVNFDAKILQSGIYYYSMQAGKYREVRKMLFLK
jgi:hypothetical protein